MPHSFGYRSRTRSMFSKAFRHHGPVHLSTYLATYKIGDFVDIKGDGSIHKGMPHKFYHGRTGIVWNVTPRAVGVIVNKRVGNRYLKKKIHVRVEHVKHSKCRQDFLNRVKENEKKRAEAKAKKQPVQLRRQPALPQPGKTIKVKKTALQTITPVLYEFTV